MLYCLSITFSASIVQIHAEAKDEMEVTKNWEKDQKRRQVMKALLPSVNAYQ